MADLPTDAEKLAYIRTVIADAEAIAPQYKADGTGNQLAYGTAYDKIRTYLSYHEEALPSIPGSRMSGTENQMNGIKREDDAPDFDT